MKIPAGWREAVNQSRTDKSMVNRKKDKQLSCFHYLCLFSCGGVQHILCCFFFLRLAYPIFPVYLHCPQNTVVSKTDNLIYLNCIKEKCEDTSGIASSRKSNKDMPWRKEKQTAILFTLFVFVYV